jgi:hypothetical protein
VLQSACAAGRPVRAPIGMADSIATGQFAQGGAFAPAPVAAG